MTSYYKMNLSGFKNDVLKCFEPIQIALGYCAKLKIHRLIAMCEDLVNEHLGTIVDDIKGKKSSAEICTHLKWCEQGELRNAELEQFGPAVGPGKLH